MLPDTACCVRILLSSALCAAVSVVCSFYSVCGALCVVTRVLAYCAPARPPTPRESHHTRSHVALVCTLRVTLRALCETARARASRVVSVRSHVSRCAVLFV